MVRLHPRRWTDQELCALQEALREYPEELRPLSQHLLVHIQQKLKKCARKKGTIPRSKDQIRYRVYRMLEPPSRKQSNEATPRRKRASRRKTVNRPEADNPINHDVPELQQLQHTENKASRPTQNNARNNGTRSYGEDQRPQDYKGVSISTQKEQRTPSYSPISRVPSPSIPGSPEMDSSDDDSPVQVTGFSTNPVQEPLDPWEQGLIKELRQLLRKSLYVQPPQHSAIKISTNEVVKSVRHGITCFIDAHGVCGVTFSQLTDDAVDLCGPLFRATKEQQPVGRGKPKAQQLTRNLQTLCAHPSVTQVLFFRTLAVNAVFSWVFNEFEEKSPAAFSSFYEQLLQLFDRYNHDLTGRLRIVSNLEYIEKVVKPTLDAKAIHYQQKLYNILSSLQMKPASQVWISQGDGQDNEKRRDFEYRSRQLLQWETAIHLAFHKALSVRLQMARSSRFYQARIFTMGDNFDPKWMEPVSSSGRDTESQRQVYLCVLPAICSYSRPPDLEDPVVVSKAQVILEINGTNAARGGADERDRSPDL